MQESEQEKAVVTFSQSFDVNVYHDHEDNLWVAECDALGLVTEAATYEELTERVWGVAPELYQMNRFGGNPSRMSLSFKQEQSYTDRIAL